MIYNERNNREDSVLDAARQIMVAARTAPKSRGVDLVEICTVTGDEKQRIVDEMRRIAEKENIPFFNRDALNLELAQAVVLIGSHRRNLSLNCGRCGFPTCEAKPIAVPCVFNTVDVGIAIGSACRTAMKLCVDSRVMYSVGRAAQVLGYPDKDSDYVCALVLSVSSKSPFFDRKPL